MRNGFGWWRLAKQVVLGVAESVASFANTTLTAASATGTADGSTANTLTLTLRDTNNAVMPSKAVTFTTELTAVDAGESTLASNTSTIEETSGTATITAHLYNADGTPLPNILAAALSLTSTGSGNTITAVDTASDRNGRFRWTFSSTSAAAKTLTLVADGITITQTVAITVSGGGAGLWTPMAISSWSTATGTGLSAMSDGGLWTNLNANYAQNGEVVAAPTGFLATNALRVASTTGASSGYLDMSIALAEIAIGETRNFRYKFQSDHPTAAEGATDNSHHCFQDGGAGSVQNFNLTDGTNYVGEWQPSLLLVNSFTYRYFLDDASTPTRLSKGVPYTFEFQMTRTGATTFTFNCWVYDADGVELFGPGDWINTGGDLLSDGTTYTFNHLPGTETLHIGNNGTGFSGWPSSECLLGYHSEVAIVSSDDNGSLTHGTAIGAHGSVVGE